MSLKVKRHYKLLVLLVLLSVGLLLGLGDQRIVAYTIEDNGQTVEQVTRWGSDVALFDDSVLYNVLLSISDTGNR